MRRSSVVRLTLLPILATAAVASAQSAPDPSSPSGPPVFVSASPDDGPPGAAQPELEPPGMTPTIYELDCDHDPNWQLRDDCSGEEDGGGGGGAVIVRGGFGQYFWASGSVGG
jgi:hypothetical protein